MAFPAKGSVIITDGNGKVKALAPTGDNEVLCLDSADSNGAKFIKVTNLLPTQAFKITATGTNNTKASTYETIIELTIAGENTSAISAIKILSRMQAGITSYDVRVYDSTNNNVIAEANFSNTGNIINDMGTISNLPINEAIIEIQAKKNGGSGNHQVFILEATINYVAV